MNNEETEIEVFLEAPRQLNEICVCKSAISFTPT